MLNELSEKQKKLIEEIVKKYRLKLVLLFGSRIDGRTHKESDVDVAYLPEKSLDFEKECRLNYEFTEIFKTDRVDTVDLRKAPPLLLFAVFKNCELLFQKDNIVFPTYRAYAFKKYIETKPLYEEKFARLKKKLDNIKI